MQTVTAEVTGSVWKLQARVGDVMEEEDTILIIESMKMEIPVEAPCRGRLNSLEVSEGDQVREGQLLATMDTDL